MTYQLTCKVCGGEFTRVTKPRRVRSKYGPICPKPECRKHLGRMVLHNPESDAQRAATRNGAINRPQLSIGCEWGIHNACNASAFDCKCSHHRRTQQPRLLAPPAPLPVTRYPEDAVEAYLKVRAK